MKANKRILLALLLMSSIAAHAQLPSVQLKDLRGKTTQHRPASQQSGAKNLTLKNNFKFFIYKTDGDIGPAEVYT